MPDYTFPLLQVGSSTLRRFLLAQQGAIPADSPNSQNLLAATHKASFTNASLTDIQRMEKVKSYFKFAFVRNPLERLVSGYNSKIVLPPLNYNDSGSMTVKEPLLRRYRSEELQRWKASHGSFYITISFSEYIQWVVDTRNEELNEHFAPVIDIIYPCRIKYDFYGNFKQFGEDVAKIMEKFHMTSDYFITQATTRLAERQEITWRCIMHRWTRN